MQVALEDWASFVDRRLEEIKEGASPAAELTLTDGRVLQSQCIALPDGGRMLTYFDITELKRRAEQLAEQDRDPGSDPGEHGPGHLHGRQRAQADRLQPAPDGALGPARRALLDRRQPGGHGALSSPSAATTATADIDEIVARRVAETQSPGIRSYERVRPDGTIIEVHRKPVAGGPLARHLYRHDRAQAASSGPCARARSATRSP